MRLRSRRRLQGLIRIEEGEKKRFYFNEQMKENTQKGQRYWEAGEVDRGREWNP